eukprot:704307-Pyramimonas_sp.AAC.1
MMGSASRGRARHTVSAINISTSVEPRRGPHATTYEGAQHRRLVKRRGPGSPARVLWLVVVGVRTFTLG